jgi:hypothetical protein
MNNPYRRIDKITGRFLPLAPGEKPPKMLRMEKLLGIKFERDYKELYLTGKLGQKRFANRWYVGNRSLIFSRSMRGGRRSWAEMLGLPLLNSPASVPEDTRKLACEICGETEVPLDNAHWVENKDGGSTKSYNILKLCPNCHRKLDRGDSGTTELARAALLLRVSRKILNNRDADTNIRKELLMRVEPIILNRRAS